MINFSVHFGCTERLFCSWPIFFELGHFVDFLQGRFAAHSFKLSSVFWAKLGTVVVKDESAFCVEAASRTGMRGDLARLLQL